MARQNRNFDFSHEFYCCKCGQRGFNVARRRSAYRELGHLKKLYCLHCKREVNFCECSEGYDYQAFLAEFNGGNFDENQNRKETIKDFFAKREAI